MHRALAIVFALVLGACGGAVVEGDPVTTPSPDSTTTTTPAETTSTVVGPGETTIPGPSTSSTSPSDKAAVTVYFLAEGGDTAGRRGPFLIPVHREIDATVAVARAAINEMLDGPEGREVPAGMSSAIPDNTILLGLSIDGGVATIDLSREFESGGGSFSMLARIAQVVYTLTQFDTVDSVLFQLDGRPVTVFGGEGLVLGSPATRADYLDLVPTIMVESPAWGAEVRSPVRVTGTAAVFEAVFQIEITDEDGKVLVSPDFVMTDEGQGWGKFDFTLSFDVDDHQPGFLRVWEYSAEDGSEQAVRVYEIDLRP